MARKRYSDEDALKVLREIDVHLHDGLDVLSSCRKAGISDKANPRLNKLQLAQSDVISFHQYMGAKALKTKIKELKQEYGRPILCTEWMARTVGSRVETHLPIFKEENVGCFTWGLVSGRTQTIHHWTDRPGSPPPALWHHDLLHPDGSPYNDSEIEVMKHLTTK